MVKSPPFQISTKILRLSQYISHELGILSGAKLVLMPVKLRRENRIKTIQSSLEIEGNTLTTEQVTQILDGKKVLGPEKDILEISNAIKVYEKLSHYNPTSIPDMLRVHKLLMHGLTQDSGKFRSSNVGIFRGKKVIHVAPPARRVASLMEDLFKFIKTNTQIPWLVRACVFHYELEFIHPFTDGNGRIGRLWQQLLLMKENPIFEFISVESMIKQNQKYYYSALEKCDQLGDSTLFIEFAFEQILATLRQYTKSSVSHVRSCTARLEYAKDQVGINWFSRKEYVILQKDVSTATASRDLSSGVKQGILIKADEQNQTRYKFTHQRNAPNP